MEKEVFLYKYFEGTLTEKEKVAFDLLLEEDPEFREQLAFEEDVKRVILEKESNELKKKLQGYEKFLPSPQTDGVSFWNPLRIAASIAVLLTVGWYFYSLESAVKTEELYANNYEKYPNSVYSITRGDTNDTSLERKAFEAYERNETKEALSYFKELRSKNGPDYVDFYLAQTYLANEDTQLALEAFLKIHSSKTDFNTEALWYASLCYLKLEKPEEAIPLLKDLIRQGTYKKEGATTLLSQLE
jgi:tetratricopeptide (TPR) repeat protein